MIVPVSVVSDKTVIDSDYISGLYSPGRSRLFHPLLKSLCSFLFETGHYVPLFKGTFCSGKTIQIFDF